MKWNLNLLYRVSTHQLPRKWIVADRWIIVSFSLLSLWFLYNFHNSIAICCISYTTIDSLLSLTFKTYSILHSQVVRWCLLRRLFFFFFSFFFSLSQFFFYVRSMFAIALFCFLPFINMIYSMISIIRDLKLRIVELYYCCNSLIMRRVCTHHYRVKKDFIILENLRIAKKK
jgi:hypothetical protein